MTRRARNQSHDLNAITAPSACPKTHTQRLRLEKNLSVDDLARASGLTPRLILSLEDGSHTPTVKVLWKLAKALEVPFSALLVREETSSRPATLWRAGESPRAVRSAVSCRSLLTSTSAKRRTELVELRLAPKAARVARPRPDGSTDSVLVNLGTAILEGPLERHTLQAGETLDWPSDVERSYFNPGDVDVVLYVVTTYPRAL